MIINKKGITYGLMTPRLSFATATTSSNFAATPVVASTTPGLKAEATPAAAALPNATFSAH